MSMSAREPIAYAVYCSTNQIHGVTCVTHIHAVALFVAPSPTHSPEMPAAMSVGESHSYSRGTSFIDLESFMIHVERGGAESAIRRRRVVGEPFGAEERDACSGCTRGQWRRSGAFGAAAHISANISANISARTGGTDRRCRQYKDRRER